MREFDEDEDTALNLLCRHANRHNKLLKETEDLPTEEQVAERSTAVALVHQERASKYKRCKVLERQINERNKVWVGAECFYCVYLLIEKNCFGQTFCPFVNIEQLKRALVHQCNDHLHEFFEMKLTRRRLRRKVMKWLSELGLFELDDICDCVVKKVDIDIWYIFDRLRLILEERGFSSLRLDECTNELIDRTMGYNQCHVDYCSERDYYSRRVDRCRHLIKRGHKFDIFYRSRQGWMIYNFHWMYTQILPNHGHSEVENFSGATRAFEDYHNVKVGVCVKALKELKIFEGSSGGAGLFVAGLNYDMFDRRPSPVEVRRNNRCKSYGSLLCSSICGSLMPRNTKIQLFQAAASTASVRTHIAGEVDASSATSTDLLIT